MRIHRAKFCFEFAIFVPFFQILKRFSPHKKLTVKDYLVQPVQRLMKYRLLLSEARMYCIKAAIDSTYIDVSID